jgi:hypothetical protein
MATSIEIQGLGELEKVLSGLKPRALDKRTKRALVVGARVLRPPIRGAAPVRTGALRKSVRVKGLRDRAGLPIAATVGPKAHHAHLVVQGHRIFGTGRRTRPNPFVERAAAPHEGRAVAAFTKELFRGQGR